MLSFDHALAILLLTTPLDPADLGPLLEAVRPAFLQLAIDEEVLDKREDQIIEGLSQDPIGDVRALQQRYARLLRAPSLEEGDRFPERKTIEDMLAFNRAHRKDLVAHLGVDSRQTEHLQMAINEVDQCYFTWSLLRDARCRFYYVAVRRQSLQQLRDVLGAEAFYRSEMPPCVPLWHFPELR